ncbi:hypothetical protein HY641_01460 [Candidatus Woesearchaeota archaeon]|nr:hypothetical protein [Candidatus Woesearchaeota archaeon]
MKRVVGAVIVLAIIAACEPVQQGCTPEQALTYLQKLNASFYANYSTEKTDVFVPIENLTESTTPPGPTPTEDLPNVSLPETAVLAPIPTKTVSEGDLVSFPNLAATDPDGDNLSYTYSEPLDTNGRWLTKRGDAGEYTATISVSDGTGIQTQNVRIIVLRKNKAPTITPIPAITIKEGQVLDLEPDVRDPDGDDVRITFSGFTSALPYNVSFDDAGNHTITITASDGELESTTDVHIRVQNVNRPPKIDKLEDVEIREGDLFTLQPTADDPDKDQLRFIFTTPLNKSGVWQTKRKDQGEYRINVTVTDGFATAKTSFLLVVKTANNKPVLGGVTNLSVKEGDAIILHITATDADNDNVSITYSGYMTSSEKRVGFSDAGEHKVNISASDGLDTVSATFTVTVADVNRPPVFNSGAFK